MPSTVTAALWFGQADMKRMPDLPVPAMPSIFETYFIEKFHRPSPTVALLATACGDSDYEVASFYRRMSRLDCHPSDLSITRCTYPDLDKLIRQQDIFYIAKGSALNLLAIWRAHGIDKTVKGMALAGTHLFAEGGGASILFEAYDSRARGSVEIFKDGLGILEGTLIQHLTEDSLGDYDLPRPIYVVEPAVAIEFRGSRGPYVVPSGHDGNVKMISTRNDQSVTSRLPIGLI